MIIHAPESRVRTLLQFVEPCGVVALVHREFTLIGTQRGFQRRHVTTSRPFAEQFGG